MQSFWQDIRYGLRLLARAPGFAVAAVMMLGLGVGSATAIFGIVDSVLLRPLPYPDSGRIVTLSDVDESGRRRRVSLADFQEWAANARSFEAIAALSGNSTTLVTRRQSRRGYAVRVHGDVLRVFGTAVAHGRALRADEIQGGAPVAVVPHAFAKSVWGDAKRAVGEAIAFEGMGFTIVGVLEPASDERTDAFVPAAAFGPDTSSRADHDWDVVARLRAGTGLAAARSEMAAIAGRLRAEHGAAGGDGAVRGAGREGGALGTATAVASTDGVVVSSLLDDTVRGVRPALLALLAAGGLLLLIACANVANLLLARGVARRREVALRQMLGASRARVVRQLIVEHLPLTLLSAGAGIALAHWSFAGLLAMVPFSLPRRAEIAIDSPALLFGLLVSLAAGLCCALAPALRAPARSLTEPLSAAGRTASGRDGTLRHALVSAQFALALAVLSCAGLLTKSIVRLIQVEPGFDYARAIVAETALPETAYASDAAVRTFWQDAIDRVARLPGVEAVGVAESAPFEGRYPQGTVEFLDESGRRDEAWSGIATAGFFRALDVPVILGRLFDDRDGPTAPHAAVINQLAAERFWPGQNPIGRRVRWLGSDGSNGGKSSDGSSGSHDTDGSHGEPLTIVGVIGNVRHQSLMVAPVPEIYAHVWQRPSRARDADLVIRSTNPAALAALTAAVRTELAALDHALPVRFHSLEGSYGDSIAQPRFQALLIGFFAICALLLSAAGLYASMAYAVSRQTREIGIRLALGGAPGAVRREVLKTAMRIAAWGGIFGALLGVAGGQLIANQLYGVPASDPVVFLTAALTLGMTALLAAYIPARRASRTNPIEALRQE